jgi:hydrogenase expression/formation protein HypE
VERARVPLPDDVAAACDAMGIAPEWALAEGALIACVRRPAVDAALAALAAAGIAAAAVGEVIAGAGALRVVERDGRERTFAAPEPDPYWPAYGRAVSEGWR